MTLQQPVFYLLAGPNGAGKSSLYRAVVADGLIPADAEFVNADLHEAAKLHHIADPQCTFQSACNGTKHFITKGMAEAVIEVFEIIEINEMHQGV